MSLSYRDWLNKYFTPEEIAQETIGGPLADADHDGLPNLLEFVSQGLPGHRDSPNWFKISRSSSATLLRWQQRPGLPTEVTIRFERSKDLEQWEAITPTEHAFDSVLEEAVARFDPDALGESAYLRIVVEL